MGSVGLSSRSFPSSPPVPQFNRTAATAQDHAVERPPEPGHPRSRHRFPGRFRQPEHGWNRCVGAPAGEPGGRPPFTGPSKRLAKAHKGQCRRNPDRRASRKALRKANTFNTGRLAPQEGTRLLFFRRDEALFNPDNADRLPILRCFSPETSKSMSAFAAEPPCATTGVPRRYRIAPTARTRGHSKAEIGLKDSTRMRIHHAGLAPRSMRKGVP